MYKGGDNMNIDNIKDNEYMTEEYLDQEIIADNDDGYNLARIAHDINDMVEGSFIDRPENLDVGATDYIDRCKDIITIEYEYLDQDEVHELLNIIMENYC